MIPGCMTAACRNIREAVTEFPALNQESFRGLPGMLADALPDRFGNRLIDAWLAETGRSSALRSARLRPMPAPSPDRS